MLTSMQTSIIHCILQILLLNNRAWRQKLFSLVKNDQHRFEIYTCLWLLLTENDKEKFSNRLQLFVKYWQCKELKFMEYFQGTYGSRLGVYTYLEVTILNVQKNGHWHFIILTTKTQTQTTFWKGTIYEYVFCNCHINYPEIV